MNINIILCCFLTFILSGFQQTGPDKDTRHELFSNRQHVDSLNELGYSLWIRDPATSITYGHQAFRMADSIDYPLGAAYAKRVSGVAYWALGDSRRALEDLYQALDRYMDLEDTLGIANSKLNIGMVYSDIDEDARAMRFYHESINGFTALNEEGRIATAFTKIGSLHLKNKNYADALTNLINALNMHTKNNFDYGMAEAHNRLGTLYLDQGNVEQADHHLRRSLVLSRNINDQDGIINSMIQYGRLQQMKGEYETSNMHLKWGLREASEHRLNNYRLLALEHLVALKKAINQPDSALFYYDWFVTLKDSVYNINKSKQIAALEFQSEIKEKEKELHFLTEKEQNSRIIQWILFAGLWIILLLSFFLIKSMKQRNKNQKIVLEQERIIAANELEHQRTRRLELERELEVKNKELTSYALHFVQKNEFLDSMNSKLRELKSVSGQDQAKKLVEMERLLKLQQSKDKDWEDFRHHFEQVYSGFFTNLKSEFPSLSSNDLKVAALTRLNLSIKETANILGISPESTKTARYRLRKKMGLPPETELFDHLMQFDHKS